MLSIIGRSAGDTFVEGEGYTLGRQRGKPDNQVFKTKRLGDAIDQCLEEILHQTGRHGDRIDWFAFQSCRRIIMGIESL